MVRCEGNRQCQKSPLDKMDKTASGDSLELQLLSYEDGRPAPTEEEVQEAPRVQQAPPRAAAAADDDSSGDEEDEEMPDLIDCHGQVWKPGVKTEIKTDARTQPRFKPSLNTGGK
eukprot:3221717-Prymnesium_polylepis.1